MTAIEKYFFTPLYYPRSPWSVLRWWEARRLMFNVWVGGAGLFSLAVVSIISRLPPHPFSMSVPVRAVAVYGILANICYSMGPVADLMLRRVLGQRVQMLPLPAQASMPSPCSGVPNTPWCKNPHGAG